MKLQISIDQLSKLNIYDPTYASLYFWITQRNPGLVSFFKSPDNIHMKVQLEAIHPPKTSSNQLIMAHMNVSFVEKKDMDFNTAHALDLLLSMIGHLSKDDSPYDQA